MLCDRCGHPMARHESDTGMYALFVFCLDCDCEIHPELTDEQIKRIEERRARLRRPSR